MDDSTNRERDILRAERLLESGAVLFRRVRKNGSDGAVEVFNVYSGTTHVDYRAFQQDDATTSFVFDNQDSGDLPTMLRNEFGSTIVRTDGIEPYNTTWSGETPDRVQGLLPEPLLSSETMASNCRELVCAGTFVAASRFQWTDDNDVLLRMLALSACGFVMAVILDTTIRRGSFASRESLRAIAWAIVSVAVTVVLVASAQHIKLLFGGARR